MRQTLWMPLTGLFFSCFLFSPRGYSVRIPQSEIYISGSQSMFKTMARVNRVKSTPDRQLYLKKLFPITFRMASQCVSDISYKVEFSTPLYK